MFARYYVEFDLDPEVVLALLVRAPESWIPGIATDATRKGDVLLANVGFGRDVRLERTVEVHLGEAVELATKTLVPLRWTPVGQSGLFPALDADLEVARIGDQRTQLAMSARYVPPLGALGKVLDRTILSRVAEATVKDFLDRVAAVIITSDRGTPGTAAIH